jgi:hypothetical protein
VIERKVLAVKHSAKLFPIALSAAVALIASLAAIVFTNNIVTLLYLVAVAILGMFALLLAIALRRGRKKALMAVAVFGAFLIVTPVVVVNQGHIRPHLLWLIWSQRYKSEVLATAPGNGEFRHVEWDGDGWGDGVSGDWMGYVVFDPSDSLSAATKGSVPADYDGIPCKVILVRRLERQWYSVVLDMNQFWDKMHPGC